MLLTVASAKLPPAPLTIVQRPAPVPGALPARNAFVAPHRFWSAPASAMVGVPSNLISTSSLVDAHTPSTLLAVHRNVYVVPASPLNVVVGLLTFTKLPPPPAITVQVPVPGAAALAARSALVPQRFWSAPALATTGD